MKEDLSGKNVKKVYGPGIWEDDRNQIHVDPQQVLKGLRLADTEANREMVIEVVKEEVRKQCPSTPIVDVFDLEEPTNER